MAVRVSRISLRTCFRRPAVPGFLAFAAIESGPHFAHWPFHSADAVFPAWGEVRRMVPDWASPFRSHYEEGCSETEKNACH